MADEQCDYQVSLTDEEREGLKWLADVLDKIHKKGPEHCSYLKAAACARALNAIHDHHQFMHAKAHELEMAAGTHRDLITEIQMAWMPKGEA